MFIAALLIIARTWRQHKCQPTDNWIKKMLYVYEMDYYSALKRTKVWLFVEMWMVPETVIQSEVKLEGEKQGSYINAYLWNLGKWYR